MSYETDLQSAREQFPFAKWKSYGTNPEAPMEQYAAENCDAAQDILETLLADLAALGPDASEEDKLGKFQTAVEDLNDLNDENAGMFVETGEREELCALFNVVAIKAGLDPAGYGDGEGPASEWRDW